jgi:hypothetical protein
LGELRGSTPHRPAPLNVGNNESLTDPAYGLSEAYPKNARDKVNAGVPASHVAYITTDPVFSFIEVKRRIRITVSVIFRSPASGLTSMDLHPKKPAHIQNRDILFDPSNIGLLRLVQRNIGQARRIVVQLYAHRKPPGSVLF